MTTVEPSHSMGVQPEDMSDDVARLRVIVDTLRTAVRDSADHSPRAVVDAVTQAHSVLERIRAGIPSTSAGTEGLQATGDEATAVSELHRHLANIERELGAMDDIPARLERALEARMEEIRPSGESTRRLERHVEDLDNHIHALVAAIGVHKTVMQTLMTTPADLPGYKAIAAHVHLDPDASLHYRIPTWTGVTVTEPVTVEHLHTRLLRKRHAFLWISVVLALVALVAAASILRWGGDFQKRLYARSVVQHMLGANSYRVQGYDVLSLADTVISIREIMSYVAPSSVETRFTRESHDARSGAALLAPCADRSVIVVGSTRYQRCNGEKDVWTVDAYDSWLLRTILLSPWMRFAWCNTHIRLPIQILDGEPVDVFSCSVPPSREADYIWGEPMASALKQVNLMPRCGKDEFIANAAIDLQIMVRKSDGYVARYTLTRSWPCALGTAIESTDYIYSAFGRVPAILPPPGT